MKPKGEPMSEFPELHIGTVGFDGPRKKTFANLHCVEYQETFSGAPSTKLLSKLREEAGEGFAFVARLSCVLTHAGDPVTKGVTLPYLETKLPATPFDTGDAGQTAWNWTVASATALGAGAIFMQTPPGFRPTTQNRHRLSDFVEKVVQPESPRLIWDSQGLWDAHEIDAICRDLALVPCTDPLVEEDRFAASAYLRIQGRARGRHGLSADELDLIADFALEGTASQIVFHTATPYRDAKALTKLLSA